MLLNRIRSLNSLMQRTGVVGVSLNEICKLLCSLTLCHTCLLDSTGRILKCFEMEGIDEFKNVKVGSDNVNILDEYNDILLNIKETRSNVKAESSFEFLMDVINISKNEHILITPVYKKGDRVGTIIMVKVENDFNEEDIIFAEYAASIFGIEILIYENIEQKKQIDNEFKIKNALKTLSYSEKEAIFHIFDKFDGKEGVFVASKIADKSGLTRSTMVNAIRKFECAGIIRSRSLGSKGTHIKILNNCFIEQFRKSS